MRRTLHLTFLALALAACAACAACARKDSGARADAGTIGPGSTDADTRAPDTPDGGRLAQGSGDAAADGQATRSADGGDADRSAWATAQPVTGRSIGHTSLVLKLRLEGGLEAAYKPRSRRPLGATRYRAEIAAHRVAKALGLENVPLALPRSFEVARLRAALAGTPKEQQTLDQDLLAEAGGTVPGALIPWINKLEILELEGEPWLSRWRGWLIKKGAVIPDNDRRVAAQISTMLVFDYLDANWDRFSGANVAIDRSTDTVLFVDNDGAFYETPPTKALHHQLDLLKRVRRFSKSFVASVRGFDAAKLKAAVGEESAGAPLLSDKSLAGFEERRRRFLDLIDQKIAAEGDEHVLYFE